MALRLLPAFVLDGDDDDDGNFTNWMSSYWGHRSEGRANRETKRSFRRTPRSQTDRRASLPCVSQLEAVRLSKLHAGAIGVPAPAAAAASSGHSSRPGEEGRDGPRPHPRARRASSDDNSRSHTVMPEGRITTIPELTESFEKRLSLGKKTNASLNGTGGLCLVCHEELRVDRAGLLEVHCTTHHPHREASRRPEHVRARSAAADCEQVKGRKVSKETDCLTPHRQCSLRRHR